MLSIIIPTHQRTDLLERCLATVRWHAPAGAEVIVVDDRSPDGRGGRIAQLFGARVVFQHKRQGFAAAVNAGIRASRGDIIELLNDDAEVAAHWADAALPWFDDPSIGSVAPLVLRWPDGNRVDSAGDRYYLGGVAGKRGHGQPLGPHFLEPTEVFGVSASSGFYRRDALERAGLFAESFGSYFEDVDLAFRLQRLGYRAMFEPSARVLHRVSASFGRIGRRLIEQQACNEERVFWRNLPVRAMPTALPKHLVVLFAKACRRWREGTLTPWALGKLRLFSEIRSLRRARKAISRLGPSQSPDAWHVESRHWGPELKNLLPCRSNEASP